MSGRFCLLVVAKAPVPGLAKTRLTPPATPRQAADIAAAALLDTIAAVRTTPGALPVVAMTGDLAAAARAESLATALVELPVIPQRGVDFANRLVHAHLDAARRHPGLPLLQIGMDTPQVTPELLADTADLLVDADAVLGRATDGGWWALGLRDARHARALRRVPMSQPDTAEHTVDALARGGIKPVDATVLSDVDSIEDAIRVAERCPDSRFAKAVARMIVAGGLQ